MPPTRLLRGYLMLWFTTGLILLIASIETVQGAFGAHQANPHVALLGAVEALGAALLLVPRTMRVGVAALLLTIGIAFLVHTVLGQFRGDLLLYAAAVAFVGIHGPLTSDQWRMALSLSRSGHPSRPLDS
jgi:hypothetical protein